MNEKPPASQHSNRPIVRRIWSLTRLVFQTIISALLSISLAQLIHCIPSIAHRLDQFHGTVYHRQIEVFRESMQQSCASPEERTPIKTQDTPIPTDMQSSTGEKPKLAKGRLLRRYPTDASTSAWTCQQDAA